MPKLKQEINLNGYGMARLTSYVRTYFVITFAGRFRRDSLVILAPWTAIDIKYSEHSGIEFC